MRNPDHAMNPAIGLKSAMRRGRISTAHLAAELADIKHGRLGNRISRTTLHYLCNHGIWPVGYDTEEIRKRIERAVAATGQSVDGLWEPEVATSDSRPPEESRPASREKAAPTFSQTVPESEMLSEAARRHFNLHQNPFGNNDITCGRDVFISRDMRFVGEAMYYAAKHNGLLAVIGESGAGKSTLKRNLIERLARSEERITVIKVKCTDKRKLTANHVCQAVLADVSSETPKSDLEGLARQVERVLAESAAAGNTHVLLIEEAHDLSMDMLRYLKRFWELEDGFRKLLGIILIGQPELKLILDERKNSKIREFIRRCEVATLRPLGDDLAGYVEHKLVRVLGKDAIEKLFEKDALQALRQRLLLSRQGSNIPEDHSYPLNVNNALVRALNQAVELGFDKISAQLVREV